MKRCKNYSKELIQKKYISKMFRTARKRAKEKKLEFNITKEFLNTIWNWKCPVLDIEYKFFNGHDHYSMPSLDRKDNTKGYIQGNVRIISYRANTLKKDGNLEEFEKILKYMEENLPKNSS